MRIIGMEKDTEQRWKSRCNYILAAWASLCAGVVNFAAFAWIIHHTETYGGIGLSGSRGTIVFLLFLLVSAAGGIAGVISLFGIRSWPNALFIIPGALFGILINGFMGLACFGSCAVLRNVILRIIPATIRRQQNPRPVKSLMGEHVVRNFVIGCIVLLAMAGTAFSETKEPPKKLAADLGGGVKMKLVLIPSGEFKMGSGESAEDTAAFFNKTYGVELRYAIVFKDEHPQHRVRITKPFYLGTYHVTRGQFRQFVADAAYKTDAEKGEKPGAWGWDPDKKEFGFNEKYSWRNAGFEQTDEHPVVNVSWNDAVAFCKWLSRKEGKTYRLPTEAEWEYACRAGTTTRYYSGDDPETLAKVGNVADAAAKAKFPAWDFTIKANDGYVFTAPVGKFKPNAFGLYDMHGNAWQWCADWYEAEYYAASPADDPTGPDSGVVRVLRGGSWCNSPYFFPRSASRFRLRAGHPERHHGLPRCQD